jgi:hypothetical protein
MAPCMLREEAVAVQLAILTSVEVATKSCTFSQAGLLPPLLTAFDPLLPTVASSMDEPCTGAQREREFFNLCVCEGRVCVSVIRILLYEYFYTDFIIRVSQHG